MNERMDDTAWQARPDPPAASSIASPEHPAQENEARSAARSATEAPGSTAAATPAPKELSDESDPGTAHESAESAQKARAVSRAESSVTRSATSPPLTPAGYKMLRKLGRGTFGEVWLAEQEFKGATPDQNKVLVAIKFFPGRDRAQLQRMLDEAKILTQLRSDPRIVYLIDHDAEAPTPFFVMDYMERGSLASRLAEEKAMPVEKALPLFREIVEAMAFVHAKGIRHCDLKPGNILINADGKPKIADFGQAHLSLESTDLALGTFFYMAPGQANTDHQVPDSRWDVYGLGALFFAMVTGRPPRYDKEFSNELADTVSMSKKLARYREWVQAAPMPTEHRKVRGMDRGLADIIDRCIAIDPAKRPSDAGAVLAALEQRERNLRQKPFLFLAALVSLVLVLALGIFGMVAIDRSQDDLQERILDGDLITARLVANVVEENLRLETGRLLEWAGNVHVRKVFLDFQREKDERKRNELRRELETYLERQLRYSRFHHLVLFDKQGRNQAAAIKVDGFDPDEPDFKNMNDHNGRDYSWRAYWNRERDDPGRADLGYKPNWKNGKDVPWVGPPFESTADSKYEGIPISLPILDHQGRFAGLLLGKVWTKDLHKWIEPIKEGKGCAVLLDSHGNCVVHDDVPLEKKMALKRQPGEDLPSILTKLKLDKQNLEEFWPDGKSKDHLDPWTAKTYLAVHVPVDKFSWHVLVQHERDKVLAETKEIRADLLKWFFGVILIAAVMSGGLWWGFFWLEGRKQMRAAA